MSEQKRTTTNERGSGNEEILNTRIRECVLAIAGCISEGLNLTEGESYQLKIIQEYQDQLLPSQLAPMLIRFVDEINERCDLVNTFRNNRAKILTYQHHIKNLFNPKQPVTKQDRPSKQAKRRSVGWSSE